MTAFETGGSTDTEVRYDSYPRKAVIASSRLTPVPITARPPSQQPKVLRTRLALTKGVRMHATQQAFRTNRVWTLCLLALIAVGAICTRSHAQTLIGSAGYGWQNWNLAQADDADFVDLNNNNSPFWDVPLYAFGSYSGSFANKNVGWCLTSTGDCQGVGSALTAPGPIPFWGGPYDVVNDIPSPQDLPGTGSASSGAIDPKV